MSDLYKQGSRELNRERALADFERFLDLLSDDPRVQKLQELFDSE
ncbi:hypothetical protein [Pseudonocardia sp. WMMC193]|nr:hypothetical protein [Pseudonocardia sp. WMMC193]